MKFNLGKQPAIRIIAELTVRTLGMSWLLFADPIDLHDVHLSVD